MSTPNLYTVAALTVLGRGPVPPRTRGAAHFEALAVVGSGLLSALSLVAFATGRTKEAYMLGIAGALTGAAIGASRILGSER